MKNKNRIYIILLFISSFCYSQQDAQYTHYMYNMSIINPAYATSNYDVLNLGLLHRTQWVGVEGAPKTYTFFAHLPYKENMELGISFLNDNIGDGVLNETNFSIDYAYILSINEKSKLSLGLKAGLNFFNTNFDGFQLESGNVQTDPVFIENENKIFPNIGAGAFYYTKKYYVGLSVPNLLKSKHIKGSDGISTASVEEAHFFLTGGYVFDLSKKVKLKPSFLLKDVSGGSLSTDLSLNALFFKRFEIGASTRLKDSWSALANFEVYNGLRIGYAYDRTVSNLGTFNSGSHEIMILYDLEFNKKSYKSPRFF